MQVSEPMQLSRSSLLIQSLDSILLPICRRFVQLSPNDFVSSTATYERPEALTLRSPQPICRFVDIGCVWPRVNPLRIPTKRFLPRTTIHINPPTSDSCLYWTVLSIYDPTCNVLRRSLIISWWEPHGILVSTVDSRL